ncbi:MAG: zinc-binding dehydrogenase [Acidimicrobiales bacterium]
MPELMRAGHMVEVGRIVCEEVPLEPAGDGEVLVRSELASICGSDLHIVMYGVEAPPGPWMPGFPGHEGVGQVLESRHPDHAPGDWVLCVPFAPLGRCFAEIQRVAGANLVTLPVDPAVPRAQLLMAQQLGTVLYAQRRHPTDVMGRTALVLGQGSAGLFWTWLLKRLGAARVVAVEPAAARRKIGERFGADVSLDPAADDVRAAVRDLTGGQGADYVVEAVGRKETLAQSIELCRADGELFWFGLPDSKAPAPISFQQFFRKRLTAHTTYGAQGEGGLASFRAALGFIERGEIDVSPLLSHVLPIERIDEAFELAHHAGDGALKVSLSF